MFFFVFLSVNFQYNIRNPIKVNRSMLAHVLRLMTLVLAGIKGVASSTSNNKRLSIVSTFLLFTCKPTTHDKSFFVAPSFSVPLF